MPPRTRFSLAGKISALFMATVLLAALTTGTVVWLHSRLPITPFTAFLVTLLIALPLGLTLIQRFTGPIKGLLQAIADGIRSFQDRDFSVRVSTRRNDELGELARLYNEVGKILHEERRAVRQRELLLQTALDSSPMAIVLVNPLDRVLYANVEARRLFLGGNRMHGMHFTEILDNCPGEMRSVLAGGTDGLFTVDDEKGLETYHLARRNFTLNRQPHALYLLRRLTTELGRQEAEIWKKAIRIISHELNNSLAPISSLAHSGQLVARDPERHDRLETIFRSIQDNTERLTRFLEGYARFARLPEPHRRPVHWEEFVEQLRLLHAFRLEGRLPPSPGYFNPAHMQQVLTNLIKNASEAANGAPDVTLRVAPSPQGGVLVQVLDRGRGMPEAVMRKALLPFYSTKQDGAGLGLPLCREILEAHGGKLRIQAREGGGTEVTCWLPPQPV